MATSPCGRSPMWQHHKIEKTHKVASIKQKKWQSSLEGFLEDLANFNY
jgi:hypothetical protein